MSNLTQTDMKFIDKYCGYELASRLTAIIERKKESTIKVVNTGMVSSGKSSLYNILTGNTENELFPTGAARTTTSADSFEYNGLKYIDTPGIDVRDEDDNVAFDTIINSDIIIMVHNIKTGPLVRSEVEWLEKISSAMTSQKMKKHRLIFVCTWKDSREKEEAYSEIVNDVRQAVFNVTGTEIPFFEISSKKYLDGIAKGKDLLCKKSGIPDFQNFLIMFAQSYLSLKEKYAEEELEKIVEQIKDKLKDEREKNEAKVAKKKEAVILKYRPKKSIWNDIYRYFKEKRKSLDDSKKELSDLGENERNSFAKFTSTWYK